MNFGVVSFWTNPRSVSKFQTDRFRTFGENRRHIEKIKKPTLCRRGGVQIESDFNEIVYYVTLET